MNYGDKKIIKSGLLCLVILANVAVYAENEGVQTLNKKGLIGKALAAMGTSSMMHHYNQFIAERLPVDGVPASADIQELGKEAQTAVGIPADRQVPIQDLDGLDGGMASSNAIMIGEKSYDDAAYGVKRCDMFHESVHIKYHDDSFNSAIYLSSLLGAPLAARQFIKPQGTLKLLYLPVLVAGHYVARGVQNQFCKYRERRADIEGHYATQCHECVTEKAENLKTTRDDMRSGLDKIEILSNLSEDEYLAWNEGGDRSYADFKTGLVVAYTGAKAWLESKKRYLSVEENEIIAADLKRDNKVCAFHASKK
jgi:hypothetical protein